MNMGVFVKPEGMDVETPRVDAKIRWCDQSERDNGDFWPIDEFIHFARQLERESAAKSQELARIREALREAFAWGLNLRHKKDCPGPASNFQRHQPCKCGRDALQTKLNTITFDRAALSEPMNEHVHTPAEDEKHG